MNSKFRPSDFSTGTTYNDRTMKFVGVDLTSPTVEVDHKRGIYSRNYVHKPNGKVETRFGYEQIFTSMDFDEIRGIWQFVDSNGDTRTVAVKTYLYNNNIYYLDLYEATVDEVGIQLQSTYFKEWALTQEEYERLEFWATESDNKLWILTGWKFLVVSTTSQGELIAARVSEHGDFFGWGWEPHVPTVTYMGIASNANQTPSNTFLTLEYPNLLSVFRKDVFLGGLGPSAPHFPLAVNIKSKRINLATSDSRVSIEYMDADEKKSLELAFIVATPSLVSGDHIGLGFQQNTTWTRIPDANAYNTYHATFLLVKYNDKPAVNATVTTKYGYVDTEDKTGLSYVMLTSDYAPLIPGVPNITIKYQWFSGTEYENACSFIDHCTNGQKFGANNSLNRLWLFGNKDKPNYAIHSQEPYKRDEDVSDVLDNDFAYIPDEGMTKFGDAANEIVGMEVVTSEMMMVVKNKGGNERTMYFVKPTTITEQNTGILREEYSTAMSNTSTAGLTRNGFCVFNGDALFLSSEKQIVGLDIEGITGDSRRSANTRSKYIDKALLGTDLSNAKLFSSSNYLFLWTSDTLYMSHYGQQADGQYEWWPCDPIPGTPRFATVLHDGTEIFVTTEGAFRLKNADGREVYDSKKLFFGYDDHVIVQDGNSLALSSALREQLPVFSEDISEDDLCVLKFASVYSDVRIQINNLHLVKRGTGPYYYPIRKSIPSTDLIGVYSINVFTVDIIDYDEVPQAILDEFGYGYVYLRAPYPITTLYFMPGEMNIYAFQDPDEERVYLKVRENGEWRGITSWNASSSNWSTKKGYFEKQNKITPVFMTTRLNHDHIGYDKTIRNLTVWNDSDEPCELLIGTITNKFEKTFEQLAFRSPGATLDFDLFDFDNLDFDKTVVPKYTNLKRFPRCQQSFTLCFTAKSKRISVLGGIDILYTVKKARNKR